MEAYRDQEELFASMHDLLMDGDYPPEAFAAYDEMVAEWHRIQDEFNSPAGWYNQPKPRRWHRCKTAESGWVAGSLVRRCACGALTHGGSTVWIEKNSRKD